MAEYLRFRALIVVVVGFLCGAVFAGEPPSPPPPFREYVDGLLDQESLRGSSWSVLIHSLDGDSTYYQRDADRRLIPASLAKLVTSAVAIDALGPNFRFETLFSTNGKVDNDGHLRGDLIVQASGDPTFSPTYLDSLRAPLMRTWVDSLRAYGIQRIDGNLILRAWPFTLEASSPDWEVGDVNDRFGPPVDGFGFNSNVSHLAIYPGAFAGASAVFTIDPPYAPLEIRSSVTTGPADSQPAITMRVVPQDTVVYLSGETPLGDDGEYLWITMQNPALYFGRALSVALQDGGINVSGDVLIERGSYSSGTIPIFEHQSPPLSEIIKLINKESDNLTSEYVLRAVGARMNKSGDLRSSLHAVDRFLREIGIGESGIYLRDGCGLSRQDLCSARGLIEILKAMYVHPAADAYIASMGVSGTDGTIHFRMSSPELIGRVHAKTGTINHVSNLAGYFFGENGQTYLFAIMCNNFPSGHRQHVRYTQDAILERLYTVTANHYIPTEH